MRDVVSPPTMTPDPRVYFAAERTLLAWIRTGITVMGFGFVVARFGLFLRLLQAQGGPAPSHGVSSYLGAALVVLGIVATGAGALEYRRFCRQLGPEELPTARAPFLPLALSWVLVALGSMLAVILLV
jgi:putative membrane protein